MLITYDAETHYLITPEIALEAPPTSHPATQSPPQFYVLAAIERVTLPPDESDALYGRRIDGARRLDRCSGVIAVANSHFEADSSFPDAEPASGHVDGAVALYRETHDAA